MLLCVCAYILYNYTVCISDSVCVYVIVAWVLYFIIFLILGLVLLVVILLLIVSSTTRGYAISALVTLG